jgi:hypothetical protein
VGQISVGNLGQNYSGGYIITLKISVPGKVVEQGLANLVAPPERLSGKEWGERNSVFCLQV